MLEYAGSLGSAERGFSLECPLGGFWRETNVPNCAAYQMSAGFDSHAPTSKVAAMTETLTTRFLTRVSRIYYVAGRPRIYPPLAARHPRPLGRQIVRAPSSFTLCPFAVAFVGLWGKAIATARNARNPSAIVQPCPRAALPYSEQHVCPIEAIWHNPLIDPKLPKTG